MKLTPLLAAQIGAGAGPAPPVNPIYEDNMDEAINTSLDLHTPDFGGAYGQVGPLPFPTVIGGAGYMRYTQGGGLAGGFQSIGSKSIAAGFSFPFQCYIPTITSGGTAAVAAVVDFAVFGQNVVRAQLINITGTSLSPFLRLRDKNDTIIAELNQAPNMLDAVLSCTLSIDATNATLDVTGVGQIQAAHGSAQTDVNLIVPLVQGSGTYNENETGRIYKMGPLF